MFQRYFNRRALPGLLLGLGTLLASPAVAQPTPTAELLRAQRAAATPPTFSQATLRACEAANPRLDPALRGVLLQGAARTAADMRSSNPDLRFGQGRAGTSVLVRIMAADVNALLPTLQAQGFELSAAVPALHFMEGMLPVSLLDDANTFTTKGLQGIVASFEPQSNGGLVTSQADYVLEADRTRAYQPNRVTGSGVNVGVLSDSFNYLNGAAANVASGDLPTVNVLSDDGTTDEGRGMAQLIYDLVPGAGLAFSTANGGEAVFAQHIRDLANTSKGNCKVIVDDIRYLAEPMFQDGVIAQAITDVSNNSGVAYFSSAGNYASKSYENGAPRFVADSIGRRRLNFDVSNATTDITQRITIANAGTFRAFMQWGDPFYVTGGVKTDLDMFLVAVKASGAVDTVYRGTTRNISTSYPVEYVSYTNNSTTSGTTTFDLVITLKQGQVPGIIKYINFGTATPSEWNTLSSTLSGHAAAAEARAVAAAPYFNQRVGESYTSRGGALQFLFTPTGTPLATPVTRQKPEFTSIDGTNTSFFGGSDYESDGYPNFFGTSAAAPHAAAVAALLRSAEPSLTPSQVYSRLAGSARLIGTTATDPLTGAGLIDAFRTVYGQPVAVAPPIAEDLEKMALPTSWYVTGTGAARAQVTSQAPASGKESLILDAYPYITSVNSLNEATLYVQGASGASNLSLTFRQRKFTAETDEQMPAQFTGSSNSDGVAMSVDGGANWYRIFDLTGTAATTAFQTQTLNLSQLATQLGLALSNDVRIKFQRYGKGGSTAPTAANAAGRDFDDIIVNNSATPAPVALYAYSPAPAIGCAGLQVQYTDTSLYRPTGWQWTFPGGTPATSTARNPLVTYNTPGHFGVTLSVTNANGTAARTDTGVVFIQGRRPIGTLTASATSICAGGTVTFSSAVTSCSTTTYAWSFPGGTPASSTAASPGAITYAANGNYTATLVVTNPYGTLTLTSPVDVGGQAIPYAEGFDASTGLPRDWKLVTPSTYAWTVVPGLINRTGATSNLLRAPFARDSNVGEYPSVYSPAINLGTAATPRLRFDLAYAPYAAVAGAVPTDIDSLIVRVADACTGTILGRVYAKGAQSTLATQASQPTDFIPTQSSWRQELVDLSAFAGKSIVLQFRGRNGYGNWLYIDNVTVGDNVLSLTSAANTVGLEAWPIPAPGGSGLNVRLPAFAGTVRLRLVDNVGREVWQQQLTQTGGTWQGTLPLPATSGLYNLLYQPEGAPAAARRVVVQ